MKKFFFIFILLSTVSFNTTAQTNDAAYYKSNSVISLGYGVNNIWKSLFKKTTNFSDYKISSAGPFALVYEFGFSKRISAGIAAGYSQTKRVLNYTSFSNTEKLTNFSTLARANYHLWTSKKADPYIGFGIGYYKFTYTSVDNTGSSTPSQISVPGAFGLSAQLGMKYYFTNILGAFAEVGYVAGSYGQVGLSLRF